MKSYFLRLLISTTIYLIYSSNVYGQELDKLKRNELLNYISKYKLQNDSLNTTYANSLLINKKLISENKAWKNSLDSCEYKFFKNNDYYINYTDDLNQKLKECKTFIEIQNKSLLIYADSLNKILEYFKDTKPLNYGGNYSLGNNIEKERVGYLKIYPISSTILLFHLELNRGAPSYNSGVAMGKIILNGNNGFYIEKDEFMNCEIHFIFGPDYVQISQKENEYGCLFGANVIIDGLYKLKSNIVPLIYTDQEGEDHAMLELYSN
jgi:hypothetical protein